MRNLIAADSYMPCKPSELATSNMDLNWDVTISLKANTEISIHLYYLSLLFLCCALFIKQLSI